MYVLKLCYCASMFSFIISSIRSASPLQLFVIAYTFFASFSTSVIFYMMEQKKTSSVGFEPTRAEPNGFQVHLLNHSDMMTFFSYKKIIITNNTHIKIFFPIYKLSNVFFLILIVNERIF